jgi:hypothetical protein
MLTLHRIGVRGGRAGEVKVNKDKPVVLDDLDIGVAVKPTGFINVRGRNNTKIKLDGDVVPSSSKPEPLTIPKAAAESTTSLLKEKTPKVNRLYCIESYY